MQLHDICLLSNTFLSTPVFYIKIYTFHFITFCNYFILLIIDSLSDILDASLSYNRWMCSKFNIQHSFIYATNNVHYRYVDI